MSVRCPDCGAVASYGRELGHKSDCPALALRPRRMARTDETRQPPSQAMSEAIASIPAHLYWLMGKGRTRPSEPLYAVQLVDPESGVAIVETEAEHLADAINAAVGQLNTSQRPEGGS